MDWSKAILCIPNSADNWHRNSFVLAVVHEAFVQAGLVSQNFVDHMPNYIELGH